MSKIETVEVNGVIVNKGEEDLAKKWAAAEVAPVAAEEPVEIEEAAPAKPSGKKSGK